MSDGTTEPLDDPADYDEFLQALKDGRYDPEKGIAPAASSAKADDTQTKDDDTSEVFWDAMNESCLDPILIEADKYRSLIEENIEEIAGNYSEENEYCTTGDEPEWVIKALLKAGACIG
jgi:hypothetical protein